MAGRTLRARTACPVCRGLCPGASSSGPSAGVFRGKPWFTSPFWAFRRLAIRCCSAWAPRTLSRCWRGDYARLGGRTGPAAMHWFPGLPVWRTRDASGSLVMLRRCASWTSSGASLADGSDPSLGLRAKTSGTRTHYSLKCWIPRVPHSFRVADGCRRTPLGRALQRKPAPRPWQSSRSPVRGARLRGRGSTWLSRIPSSRWSRSPTPR
mmetsp:Transcript_60940/g.191620  ORF Transcript_60940/g.191620 Transcript_60940/m.191620 type:complete len:209 (+) Transcript_60940:374-1000(+)